MTPEELRHGKKVVLVTTERDLTDFPPEAWENCEKIVLNDEQFDALVQMLERPPRTLPKLAKLFAKPSLFDAPMMPSSLMPRRAEG